MGVLTTLDIGITITLKPNILYLDVSTRGRVSSEKLG